MTKKFDLITIGGATQDLSVVLNDYQLIDNRKNILAQKLLAIEYGAKTIVEDSFVDYGGGASNLALSAARCGLKTACLMAIGNDQRGQDIINNLKTNKINTNLAQTIAGQQSAASIVLIGQDREHTIIAYRGANDRLEISATAAKQMASSWLYISSLSGSGWLKNLTALFNSGKNIAWNPGQIQLAVGLNKLKPFLEKTAVLIINQDEALQLLASQKSERGHLNYYSEDMDQLVRRLWFYGPKLLVITADSRGAWTYDGQKIIHQPAYPTKKIVDTTGVGDAFGGTLVASLIKNKDLKTALRLAAKQSSAALTKRGAQSGLLDLTKSIR